MARRQLASFCLAALCLCGAQAEEPQPAPRPARKDGGDPLLQLVRSLSPEQKTRLIESIKAWQELTPEIKQALRSRDTALKKNFSDEIDAALEGVQYSPEQRATFEKRYKEERRKLDLALRAELDTRRKAGLQEIVGQIKTELAAPPK